MKFSMVEENDEPKNTFRTWVSNLWIVRKVLNPIAFWLCKLFFKKRLNWITPALAVGAIVFLASIYFLTGWWIKQQIITVAPWTYIRTAKASEMTTEQYIKLVFGKDAKVAVAVAKAESGMRCDAQNVNKGTNSLDLGAMQINSVHLRKGWKVADLLDCHKNIDLAYEIYKGSGWGAWSTYKNGSYKRFLK